MRGRMAQTGSEHLDLGVLHPPCNQAVKTLRRKSVSSSRLALRLALTSVAILIASRLIVSLTLSGDANTTLHLSLALFGMSSPLNVHGCCVASKLNFTPLNLQIARAPSTKYVT